MSAKLLVEKDGDVGYMIFNNPDKLNAISLDMWEAMSGAVADLDSDPTIKVIVVKGTGHKAFIAGADVSKYEEERLGDDAQEHYATVGWRGMMTLYNSKKTTIAAMNGFCYGGGISVAVCCDLRYGSATLQVAQPALRYGIGYRYKSLRLVVDVVGIAAAKELLLGGAVWDAQSSLQRGYVSGLAQVNEDFDTYVNSIARRIARGAPLTALQCKFALNQIVKDPADRDLETAERMFLACYASEDYKEGVRAFAEKRKPIFHGS